MTICLRQARTDAAVLVPRPLVFALFLPDHPGVLRPVDVAHPAVADRGGPGGRYWWELSLRQVEVSRTIVFDAPRQARAFFEALIAGNLDLGRPENVEVLFKRDPRGRTPKDQGAGGTFNTAIDRRCDGVTINAF